MSDDQRDETPDAEPPPPEPTGPPQEPEDEVLDISLEDLGEEPPAARAGLPGGLPPVRDMGPVLDISTEDLRDVPETRRSMPPPPGQALFPAVEAPGAYAAVAAKKSGLAEALIGATMLQMLIAGALGGVLAWCLTESTMPHEGRSREDIATAFVMAAIFFAAVGGCVGAALGSVEGLVSLVWQRALRGLLIGLGIGGVGGAFGGIMGQFIYGVLGGGQHGGSGQIVVRALGWGIVGLFIGLGEGASTFAVRKVINGLIGGAVGGFVGGLLFDPIGQIAGGGTVSRLIAVTVMGACTGGAIGLVEQLRKEAWVRIVLGPLAGKEFILYRPVTLIGSAPGVDIPLVKDPQIAPKHCSIEQAGGGYVLRDLGSGAGTYVGGRPVSQQRLRSGDVIQVGNTGLEYGDRAVRPGVPQL